MAVCPNLHATSQCNGQDGSRADSGERARDGLEIHV